MYYNTLNFYAGHTDQVGNIRLAYYKDASGNLKVDRTTHFYPFGLEFGGDLSTANSISPNYKYSSQGQEKQTETGWSSYRWRNYDAGMARFFNVDPLSEKYDYQSHYNFSENRVVDARELEGLEAKKVNEVSLPGDPVEFAEFIGGGINSIRAAFSNSVVRTANVITNDAVRNKYVVDEDGSLTLLTGVPKESFKEKVVNGSFDLATLGMAALGGPEGVLTMQGGKAPAIKAVEEVKNLQKAGRTGKQARLIELAEEPKLGKADKGWLKSDINKVAQGKRTTIRNPPGKDLAHERGREAAKGYSYKYSHLQDRSLHRKQHKYE
ncbi:polymorphic toxin type 8 domain-containing protein [Chryseobacterium sediminis]|uniref:polymorphic toxin type 8 domain-containing protein n=1 Tax=Chryseobacterium sediminis TaxID=1679494 RepID=UPI001F500CAE|nr:polymorphic toxin type 8 domain-containing protein [Chryseobacterium sediminis]